MSGLERYLAILGGRSADHLPRLPILMQFSAERIGSNYGAFAADHRVLTDANIACAREFGIDQMNTMSDPVSAILRSTPEKIRAHTLSCYEQAGNPFMVSAGREIPSATPAENLLALCEPVPFKK